jgi:hypothetical protein
MTQLMGDDDQDDTYEAEDMTYVVPFSELTAVDKQRIIDALNGEGEGGVEDNNYRMWDRNMKMWPRTSV